MRKQYIVEYSGRLVINRAQLVEVTGTSWEGSSRLGRSVKRHLRQKQGAADAAQRLLVCRKAER